MGILTFFKPKKSNPYNTLVEQSAGFLLNEIKQGHVKNLEASPIAVGDSSSGISVGYIIAVVGPVTADGKPEWIYSPADDSIDYRGNYIGLPPEDLKPVLSNHAFLKEVFWKALDIASKESNWFITKSSEHTRRGIYATHTILTWENPLGPYPFKNDCYVDPLNK